MMTKEQLAIDVVSDYLVELLQKKNWCRARSVGNALEKLVQGRQAGEILGEEEANYPTPPTPVQGRKNTY